MYKKILVATDGSELTRKAIAVGIELASLGNGRTDPATERC